MHDENSSHRPVLTLAELNAYDSHDGNRRLCPLCGDSKPRDSAHRSLSFDAQSGLWKCFRCGHSGKLREFWQEKAEFQPIQQRSRQRLRQAFDLGETIKPAQSDQKPLKSPLNAPEHTDWRQNWDAVTPLSGTIGESYLQKRGVPLAVAHVAEVRFASSWFGQAAVVFPVKNRTGEIVAAQGRAVRGAAKLTCGPKRDGVFWAPALKSHASCAESVFSPLDSVLPAIILTEAPIDALSLAACGFPALALCGTSGPDWLRIACGLRFTLLAFDADQAGDNAALSLAERLQTFGARCRRLTPPCGKDWNEALINLGHADLSDWLTSEILLRE
jgi:hypothetical protein